MPFLRQRPIPPQLRFCSHLFLLARRCSESRKGKQIRGQGSSGPSADLRQARSIFGKSAGFTGQLSLPAVPAETMAPAVQESKDSDHPLPQLWHLLRGWRPFRRPANQPVTTIPVSAECGSSAPDSGFDHPVRYAATAQIIQSAAVGTKQDESKKEIGAALDQSVRADAHAGIRTDMVTPRVETTSQAPSASAPAAPPQAAPAARMEPVVEPPARAAHIEPRYPRACAG